LFSKSNRFVTFGASTLFSKSASEAILYMATPAFTINSGSVKQTSYTISCIFSEA